MIYILVHPKEKQWLGSNPNAQNHPAMWYMPKSVKPTSYVHLITPTSAKALRTLMAAKAVSHIVTCSNEALTFAEEELGMVGVVRTSSKLPYGEVAGASATKNGIRVVTLPTIPMIRSSREVKFLMARLLRRCSPEGLSTFAPPIYFSHSHIKNIDDWVEPWALVEHPQHMLNVAGHPFHPVLMSVDLETKKGMKCQYSDGSPDRYYAGIIDLVGFSILGYFQSAESSSAPPLDQWVIYTYTSDFAEQWQYDEIKRLMAADIPKVMSNGMYDCQYFLRWGIPVRSYLGDTEYMWRSVVSGLAGWYSLQDQTNVYLRNSTYWKDGRDATSRKAYQTYCAMDCHNTAHNMAAMLAALGQHTFRNYVIRFARVPYALSSSLSGMLVDEEIHAKFRDDYEERLYEANKMVKTIFGCSEGQSAELLPFFQGMAALAKASGVKDVPKISSTDKDAVRDLSVGHPMFEYALGFIKEARRCNKWLSTYINMDFFHEGFNGGTELFSGRKFMFWTLQPFGTDTGRFASNGSSFWVGMSAHTFPGEMRSMLRAPPGYVFVTSDAPQSESRVTAHEAMCEAMKLATESKHDFHATNASAFFGIDYNEIYSDLLQKTLNKPLRDLSKRTNHGANYNMGAWVMLTTMGITYVRQAQALLKLPEAMSPLGVCKFLLDAFAKRYPEVKIDWVIRLIVELCTSGRLVHQVSGYAPLMLGNPVDNKLELNTAIATVPQGTSAYISIVGSMKLFADWLYGRSLVKPLLQLHDENIGLVADTVPMSHVDNTYMRCCENHNTVKWLGGSATDLSIPVGEVVVGRRWSQLKYDPIPRSDDKFTCKDYLP